MCLHVYIPVDPLGLTCRLLMPRLFDNNLNLESAEGEGEREIAGERLKGDMETVEGVKSSQDLNIRGYYSMHGRTAVVAVGLKSNTRK